MSHTPLPRHLTESHRTRRRAHAPTAKAHPASHVFLSIIFLVASVVFLAYAASSYYAVVKNTPRAIAAIALPTPTPHFQNIALMGYGGGNHDGGALTDSIIVARVDDKMKKIFLISLPRDLWVELPVKKGGERVGHKINAAYALGLDDAWYAQKPSEYQSDNGGGGALAKYALAQVSGERIDHFVAVSFAAFTTLIDSLGGITITRSTPFVDSWYPTEGKEKDTCEKSEEDLKAIEATLSGYLKEQEFPCRYEKLSFGVGSHTLDGATALKYARTRHSDTEGGDFYRSQRQRQVILAIKEKVLSIQAVPALVETASKLMRFIDTDYALQDIPALISTFFAKKDYTIETIALTNENVLAEGTGPNGEYLLKPRSGLNAYDPVHEYLQDRYFGFSEASSQARFDAIVDPPTPTPTTPRKRP